LQNPEEVKKFVFAYKKGFLPRGLPYSPYYNAQSYETELLFKLFVNAKDYDTFYKVTTSQQLLYDITTQQNTL
jgi:hypothetical protein